MDRYPLASLGVSLGLGLLISGALPDMLRSTAHNVGPMVRSSLVAYITSAIKS